MKTNVFSQMKKLHSGISQSLAIMSILFSFNCPGLTQTLYNAGKYQLLYQDGKYFNIGNSDTIRVPTDYLLIKLKDSITENERIDFISRHQLSLVHATEFGVERYQIDQQANFIDLINSLDNDEFVEAYDANHLIPLSDTDRPNDGYSEIQQQLAYWPNLLWPYDRTELFKAWELWTGDTNIIIADIDAGLWIDHPDIGLGNDDYSNLWKNYEELRFGNNNQDDDGNGKEDDFYGWNFTEGDNDIMPIGTHTHGVRMSGIIAGKTNNNLGIWGIAGGYNAPGVKLMMVKCNSDIDFDKIDASKLPEAIEYAVNSGARIINMPFGIVQNVDNVHEIIVDYYNQGNVVFLAATGNQARNPIDMPARFEEVIAVGATECDAFNIEAFENPWWLNGDVGTNYGAEVDLSAPGGLFVTDIIQQPLTDTYVYKTYESDGGIVSTSRAVTFACGVVALMLSANPCLTNTDVYNILTATAIKLPSVQWENGHNDRLGFGRINVLKALQPIFIDTIRQNVTWNEDITVYNDIIIDAGHCLTIDHCTVSCSRWVKFIVYPGAKLIIQNQATINGVCNQMWDGIEVWGNSEVSQYCPDEQVCGQGKLILINATIENAKTAVELYNPEEAITTGGIIKAENSYFINNARSIHAYKYRNFNPEIPSMELDYNGTFSNCTFKIDEYYPGEEVFYKHVDLDQVRGIKFYGCTFELDHQAENVSEWNLGIAAYNAGFYVLPTCTTQVVPCPLIDSCQFNGFHWAIGTYNNYINPVQIVNAHFDDNVVGILISSTNYPVILENFFEVGFDEGNYGTCGFAHGLGIDIHSSIGFAVENNIFRKNLQAPLGIYAGIRAFWCRTEYDQIYKNDFRGLTYGNYAEGTNRKDPLESNNGIEYLCNQNYINIEDFRVTGDRPEFAMIRGTHGNRVTASGNRFSRSTSPYNWDFWYGGTQIINWHYCEAPCVDEKPVRIHELEKEYFVEIESPESNDCLDHYGGGGHIILSEGEKTEKELDFTINQSDYNAVYNLYESLKDGGNTPSELNDIQIAEPDEMWDLRTQLLGHSPHLSQDVLRAVSDRTDVFPDEVLLEILAANPDELNRDKLLSFLEQKEDPLPGYMIEILRQAVGGVTYKTILLDEMAKYHAKQHQAAQDIIRSILHDTLFDVSDYRDWLDNLGSIEADKEIISSYIHLNDTTNAKTLLYLLPTLYELEGAELEEYSNYRLLIEMQIDWMTNGKSIFELDSLEIGLLEEIAIDGKTGSGNLARNILTYAYNHQYCDCLEFTDSTQLKSNDPIYSNTLLNDNYGLEISASPNPAHTWVAINYKLPLNETSGEIRITDITGKIMDHFKVNSNVGQDVWNTREVDPGLYYVTIISSGFSNSVKLVIH